MVINSLLTKIFYAGTLLFSLFAISSSSQVVSVILLIASFVCAALFLINLGMVFVGLSYIVIYVGAIAVLFLFVIMMIDINKKEVTTSDKEYTQNLPLAISLGSIFTIFYSSLVYISPTSYYLPAFTLKGIVGLFEQFVHNTIYKLNNLVLGMWSGGNTANSSPVNPYGEKAIESTHIVHYSSSGDNSSFYPGALSHSDTQLTNFEQISSLGFGLYNYYPVVYLLSGFILLFSMYSAVTLSKLKQ